MPYPSSSTIPSSSLYPAAATTTATPRRSRVHLSLELNVEIETADGVTYSWRADARDPGNRPQGIRFSTKLMDGFATCSLSLSRPALRTFPDLGLYDTLRVLSEDGTIVYEGRVARLPKSIDPGHRIDVEAVGWMSHMRDEPFTELIVDRDISAWHGPTSARQNALQALSYAPRGQTEATRDGVLRQAFDGAWPAGEHPIVEGWYDAGPGNLIGSLYYAWTKGANVDSAVTNWSWGTYLSTDRLASTVASSGNLRATGPGTGTLTATAEQRYAIAQFLYGTGPAGADGTVFNLDWTTLAVYGDHGITLRGTDPKGVFASDVLRFLVKKYAPRLNTTNVRTSGFIIDQAVWRDPTDVYSAALQLNAYERWHLAVWEDRQLHYHPLDLTDPDWIVRTDTPGVRVSFQGPSNEASANGVIVRFQNVETSAADMVTPDTHPELAVADPSTAANRHALRTWAKLQLPNPNSPAGAARIGAKVLAEYNRAKEPGRVTAGGTLMNLAGTPRPAFLARAGDTILIEDHPDDRPRLIHETSWDQDSKTLTLTLDAQEKSVDAILDQLQTKGRER